MNISFTEREMKDFLEPLGYTVERMSFPIEDELEWGKYNQREELVAYKDYLDKPNTKEAIDTKDNAPFTLSLVFKKELKKKLLQL